MSYERASVAANPKLELHLELEPRLRQGGVGFHQVRVWVRAIFFMIIYLLFIDFVRMHNQHTHRCSSSSRWITWITTVVRRLVWPAGPRALRSAPLRFHSDLVMKWSGLFPAC